MPRFLCYATENRYQGLHGIENTFVIEAKDIEEKAKNLSTRELDTIACNEGYKSFLEEYYVQE